MALTAVAYVVASALYAGFQWTIRVLVYPQFVRVGGADFPAYERSHQRLVSIAVGPLFVALGGAAWPSWPGPRPGWPGGRPCWPWPPWV